MKNLLHEFWSSASDACPLEASDQEKQELAFEIWYNTRKPKAFNEAVRPLIKWLAENHHPHTTIILTSTGAELVEGLENTGQILDYIPD